MYGSSIDGCQIEEELITRTVESNVLCLHIDCNPFDDFVLITEKTSPAVVEPTTTQSHIIDVEKLKFTPDTITINTGDTIVWRNTREGRWNTFQLVGTRECYDLKSPLLGEGEQFEWTFEHPMKCTVVDIIYVNQMMVVEVI